MKSKVKNKIFVSIFAVLLMAVVIMCSACGDDEPNFEGKYDSIMVSTFQETAINIELTITDTEFSLTKTENGSDTIYSGTHTTYTDNGVTKMICFIVSESDSADSSDSTDTTDSNHSYGYLELYFDDSGNLIIVPSQRTVSTAYVYESSAIGSGIKMVVLERE